MRPGKALHGDHRRCENCAHFFQHYVRHCADPRSFQVCHCGHCCMPRLKHTSPDRVCSLFTQKEKRT